MTLDDVRAAIERIREVAHDPEQAHHDDDVLRETVLRSIADGTADDPAEMARLALTTDEIDFDRWYA